MQLKFLQGVQDETEYAFASLDMFVLGERADGDVRDVCGSCPFQAHFTDGDQIFDRLDSYVTSIVAAYPDIYEATPRQKASIVAHHLLEKQWVGISDERHYHSLDHMFLGVALFSGNRNSVPLISAIIFCYICRRFGLYAEPVSYPNHVHAFVKPPTGLDLDGNLLPSTFVADPSTPSELTHLFMDPFNSSEPVTLAYLNRQLSFFLPHSSASARNQYLQPASARDLIFRAAQNILSAPSRYPEPPLFPVSSHAASYAALFAFCILPSHSHPAQLNQHIALLAQHLIEHFELDVQLFEHHVLPLTTMMAHAHAFRELISNLKVADKQSPKPKRRRIPVMRSEVAEPSLAPPPYDDDWRDNARVKYSIGSVFRHRRRDYLAVIYGWDPFCKMDEQWIAGMGVDRLPNGRAQPFYNVLVEDETTRYVAEENVRLLERDQWEAMGVEDGALKIWQRFPIEIGKHFKRWDGAEGRFVSNISGQYPDD